MPHLQYFSTQMFSSAKVIEASVRSGSCSYHILKNIWSPAVHKGLHYHSNSDVLYVVVVLKMSLYLLYCLICPLDFFLGN